MVWCTDNISEKITSLRRHLKISQANLADTIGYTRACVCNYEAAKNMPPIDFIVKICNQYKIDPYYWFLNYSTSQDYLNGLDNLNSYIISNTTGKVDLLLKVFQLEKDKKAVEAENEILKNKLLEVKRITADVKKLTGL